MLFVKKNTTSKVMYFVDYSSVGICLIFFLRLDVGYGFEEEYYRGQVSPSYQECNLSTWLITVDINLGHQAEIVFVRFLYCEVVLFVSCFILYALWTKVPMCNTHLKSKELCITSLMIKYLQKLFMILHRWFVYSIPYIYFLLLIYVSIDAWILTVYFLYNLISWIRLLKFS